MANKYIEEAKRYRITRELFEVYRNKEGHVIEKEITEFWPILKKLKGIIKSDGKYLVIDVGAGVGMFDYFIARYFRGKVEVLMIDKDSNIQYEKYFAGLSNVRWIIDSIANIDFRSILQEYKSKGYTIIVTAIHLCKNNLTTLVSIINKNKDLIDYFFAVPCCVGSLKGIKMINANGREEDKYKTWSYYVFFSIDSENKTIKEDKHMMSPRNMVISARFKH